MLHPQLPRVGAAVFALSVVVGGIGVASLTSASSHGGGAAATQNRGTLTIELADRAGTVTYQPPGDGEPVVQVLGTTQPCAALVLTGEELLTFTPTANQSPSVQLPSDGIGVQAGANCGVPSGFVSNDQTLTVGLGAFFAGIDASVRVDTATLDIERRAGSSLKVTYDDGSTEVVASAANLFQATLGSANDFVTFTMEPQGGNPAPQRGVALRGGVFNLVSEPEFDNAVPCGGEVLVNVVVAGGAEDAVFVRGQNDGTTEPEECEDIGVTLEIRDGGVFLGKGTTGLTTGAPQAVNARIEITWEPQTPMMPLPPRQVNFDGDPDGEFEDVLWCESYDADVDTWKHPDVPWCLVSNDEALVEIDGVVKVQQIQVYDGSGDPLWK